MLTVEGQAALPREEAQAVGDDATSLIWDCQVPGQICKGDQAVAAARLHCRASCWRRGRWPVAQPQPRICTGFRTIALYACQPATYLLQQLTMGVGAGMGAGAAGWAVWEVVA